MQATVNSLQVSQIIGNIATIVMSVTFTSDDGATTWETAQYTTSFNTTVDGEQANAEANLQALLTAHIPDVQALENYNLNSAPALTAIQSSATAATTASTAVSATKLKA